MLARVICDGRQPLPERLRESDVLVVGAGAVGIVLAVALAGKGRSVTLLEAGPAAPPRDYARANLAPQRGRPHLGLSEGRMKALGGTTRLWGGQLAAFCADDFAADPLTGKPGWPIAYDEYRRWVDAALDLLGVPRRARDGDSLFAQVTGEEPDFGPGMRLATSLWLRRPDFARHFAAQLEGLAGLTVITDAEVERLVFDAGGSVAQVASKAGAFAARDVVLACGTFEIAGLLLRAARDEPLCPFADNRHLGKWFIDHLHGVVGELVDADARRLSRIFDTIRSDGLRFSVKLRASPALRRQAGPANAAISINPRMGLRAMLGELGLLAGRAFSWTGPRHRLAALREGFALSLTLLRSGWRLLVRRRAALPFARGTYVGIEVEQLPCAESAIFLDADRAGLDWGLDGREMRTVTAMALAAREQFAEQGLGRIVLDPRVEAGDPAFLDTMHDAYHQMGGARMAASAENGVVDPDLTVFGTGNLHVAGAAVFPSGSFANPTLTALALALRLADRLAEKQACSSND